MRLHELVSILCATVAGPDCPVAELDAWKCTQPATGLLSLAVNETWRGAMRDVYPSPFTIEFPPGGFSETLCTQGVSAKLYRNGTILASAVPQVNGENLCELVWPAAVKVQLDLDYEPIVDTVDIDTDGDGDADVHVSVAYALYYKGLGGGYAHTHKWHAYDMTIEIAKLTDGTYLSGNHSTEPLLRRTSPFPTTEFVSYIYPEAIGKVSHMLTFYRGPNPPHLLSDASFVDEYAHLAVPIGSIEHPAPSDVCDVDVDTQRSVRSPLASLDAELAFSQFKRDLSRASWLRTEPHNNTHQIVTIGVEPLMCFYGYHELSQFVPRTPYTRLYPEKGVSSSIFKGVLVSTLLVISVVKCSITTYLYKYKLE